MIKISVDEGAAFDILSIACIKAVMNPQNSDGDANMEKIWYEICVAIGREIATKVISSPEYRELMEANTKIYVKIDSLKIFERVGDAKVIDELNHSRYVAKQKIQQKYFGSNLTEQKFGYKND